MSAPEEPETTAVEGSATTPLPAPTTVPGAPAGTPEPVLRIPTLGRRITIGSIRAALTIVGIVIVPWWLLNLLGGFGLTTPVALAGIIVLGIVVALVGAIRYIARPTRAFGPMTSLASVISLVYLLYLIPIASVGIDHGNDISIALDFGRFLQYALLVPLFGIAAGVVTTVEDFVRPGERVRYEYAL
ncbi:MAG: hypothetical protein L3J73_03635 [Thermoplasmata archaeon]|nr:hypothetical protein [Thermoplasmata archaeon]